MNLGMQVGMFDIWSNKFVKGKRVNFRVLMNEKKKIMKFKVSITEKN